MSESSESRCNEKPWACVMFVRLGYVTLGECDWASRFITNGQGSPQYLAEVQKLQSGIQRAYFTTRALHLSVQLVQVRIQQDYGGLKEHNIVCNSYPYLNQCALCTKNNKLNQCADWINEVIISYSYLFNIKISSLNACDLWGCYYVEGLLDKRKERNF